MDADRQDRGQRAAGLSRRRFLTLVGLGGAAAGATTLAGCSLPGTSAQPASFSPTRIARLGDLKTGSATQAHYPDGNSPVLVFKLGQRVPDGVGPDQDVVAYSSLCTHLGCPVAWRPDVKVLSCPCHFSSFDPARGGMLVIGQATTNLPQLILEVHGQDVVATGIRGLVWGRQTNLQQLG